MSPKNWSYPKSIYFIIYKLVLLSIVLGACSFNAEEANSIGYSEEQLHSIVEHMESHYMKVERYKRSYGAKSANHMYRLIAQERYELMVEKQEVLLREKLEEEAQEKEALEKKEQEKKALAEEPKQASQEENITNNNNHSNKQKEDNQKQEESKSSSQKDEPKQDAPSKVVEKDTPPKEEKQPSPPSITDQVIQLVNVERGKHGLSPLQADSKLNEAARHKSEDMRDNNYFDHTSPTFGPFTNLLNMYNISYRYAAENIAAGQHTAEAVVQAWMNSEGHRRNILHAQITHIGVGYANGGNMNHYWTQLFIQK